MLRYCVPGLCSNQDAILELGNGDAGVSWGPFVQNVGSFFIDTSGQEKVDTVWKNIKVRKCSGDEDHTVKATAETLIMGSSRSSMIMNAKTFDAPPNPQPRGPSHHCNQYKIKGV